MVPYLGGAFLILAGLLLIVLVHPRCSRKDVMVVFLVVVGALHAVSFVNVFSGPLPGAQWDARTFHHHAAQFAEAGQWPVLSIGTMVYEYILTGAYRLLGSHMLVGQSLSVLLATLALITVSAITVNLGVVDSRVRAGIILGVGLYPTFLYQNALTFREPYELLGLVLGVFFVLKALEEYKWRWVVGAVSSFVFMGLFHHVLLGICVLLICIFVVLLYAPGMKSKRNYATVTILVAMITGVGYVAITNIPITLENDYIKKIRREQGLVEAIVQYRSSIESRDPRTSYDPGLDESSGPGLALAVANNYWNYLARPYISDLESAVDIIPFASSWVRVALLAFLLCVAMSRRRLDRRIVFCACVYLVVTTVWSLGTTNYGQAFRHHALTDWLLVVMAGHAVRSWTGFAAPRVAA